jgi:hypothetical protein
VNREFWEADRRTERMCDGRGERGTKKSGWKEDRKKLLGDGWSEGERTGFESQKQQMNNEGRRR